MISSIEIEGYRLLDGFKASFDRLTVVIGANASGKSTLTDLLFFITHSVDAPLRDVVGYHGGMFSIANAQKNELRFGWN